MFSLASVILSTGEWVSVRCHFMSGCLVPFSFCGGGGESLQSLHDVTFCLAAWSHVPSGGFLSLVPCSFQGGLCLWLHVPGQRPLERDPLDRDTHPLDRDPLGQRVPLYSKERTVHILLECILVDTVCINITVKMSVRFSGAGTKIYGSSSAPLSPHCLSDHGSES